MTVSDDMLFSSVAWILTGASNTAASAATTCDQSVRSFTLGIHTGLP